MNVPTQPSDGDPAFVLHQPSTCDLCGLPLRYDVITHTIEGQALTFCCQGCRMVYAMLLESTDVNHPEQFKETDLYRQCVAAGVIPADEDDLRRLYEKEKKKPDTPETVSARPDPTDTLALTLSVEGMWCTACAWVIEKSIARLAGVHTVSCNFSTDRLRCRYRPDRIAPDQIREAVTRLGYHLKEIDVDTKRATAHRRELIRLSITGLLSANVMMLSWALYAGFFTTLSQDAVSKISLPIVAMATVAMVYGGGPMLRKAWFGLLQRMPGMETLVGTGAGCAFFYSLHNWLTGSIHLYFDTACMLITLVLLGKYLEQQAKDRVRRDLDNFFDLQPAKVRLITGAFPAGRYVAIDQLTPGDQFGVEMDEIVPADGRVASGAGRLDESSLTGEPKPVNVKSGDPIKSGTRLISGRIVAEAEKVADDTILGQMIAIMTRSLEQKSAFEAKSDRMLRWFVPVIICLSVVTGLFCILAGLPTDQAIVRAVTVMVISCPCALGVAIPMARLAGMSLAGRGGILVREMEAFERAGDIDTIVFDKTGTLTHGRWQLNHVECAPGFDLAKSIAWAAGLEQSADHEIARAIGLFAKQHEIEPQRVEDVSVHPDGVSGRLNGKSLRVGKQRVAVDAYENEDTVFRPIDGTPTSRVFLSVDGYLAATFYFGDTIRTKVPAMVKRLINDRYHLHLISGDDHATTRQVGNATGMGDCKGNLLPPEKADYIGQQIVQGHRVAMVGDGVNDAAAMARSQLGVAVYSGAGLAEEAAHITLMRGDPCQLLDFFPLARRVDRKVVQNLWCAWVYNLVSIPIAMSGLLNPLVAATAMLLSSLTVIGNTLLLLRERPPEI